MLDWQPDPFVANATHASEHRSVRYWSEETNATTIGEVLFNRVADGAIDGHGAPSGPNHLLFWDVDRLLEASRGRSGSG